MSPADACQESNCRETKVELQIVTSLRNLSPEIVFKPDQYSHIESFSHNLQTCGLILKHRQGKPIFIA